MLGALLQTKRTTCQYFSHIPASNPEAMELREPSLMGWAVPMNTKCKIFWKYVQFHEDKADTTPNKQLAGSHEYLCLHPWPCSA